MIVRWSSHRNHVLTRLFRRPEVPVAISIGIGVLVVVIAAVAYIATRPASFRYQRRRSVSASPQYVFSIINDLHQWELWSPYDKRDPNIKKTFAGPSEGPGASYSWNGNSQVGEGRLTIAESKPGELVPWKLEFSGPSKATNEVNFVLVPSQAELARELDHGRKEETSSRKRCVSSWTWIKWWDRILKWAWPTSTPWPRPARRRPYRPRAMSAARSGKSSDE